MSELVNIYSKVAASGTAGLLATVIVGLLGIWGITLPAAVVAAIVTLVSFIAGYVKRETHVAAALASVGAVTDKVVGSIEAAAESGPAPRG